MAINNRANLERRQTAQKTGTHQASKIAADRPERSLALVSAAWFAVIRFRNYGAVTVFASATSSVTTVKFFNQAVPNEVVIATSAASRPVAISTRPIRGALLRASNVHHLPSR